ncbi:hypothetical protein [Frigidibacter oleivorans]|uniref:hypothetical protein n=1 Tax=Frigidibacter oleivorans TaxID=2487129 RepID=UPI000F8DA8E6|nr:hypothetical protein [Frigidibacter oleivorans]
MRGRQKPCGTCGICPAAAAIAWNQFDLGLNAVAAWVGSSRTSLVRAAEAYGFPGRRKPVTPRLSVREISRLWGDETIPVAEAAARAGISSRCLYVRAKRLGLPPRRGGPKSKVRWPDDFDAMWAAGVLGKEIAAAAIPPAHTSQVASEVRRRGLKRRGCGPNPEGITLLAYRMRQVAAAERAAFKALQEAA